MINKSSKLRYYDNYLIEKEFKTLINNNTNLMMKVGVWIIIEFNEKVKFTFGEIRYF